jgi:hypothetical protein
LGTKDGGLAFHRLIVAWATGHFGPADTLMPSWLYTRPRDPDQSLVCLDKTSKPLIAETDVPVPIKPVAWRAITTGTMRNSTTNLQ